MSEDLDGRLFDEELSEEGSRLWQRADQLYEVGDFQGALVACQQVLAIMPAKEFALESLLRVKASYCQERLGNFEAALEQVLFARDCYECEHTEYFYDAQLEVLLEDYPELNNSGNPFLPKHLTALESYNNSEPFERHKQRGHVFAEKLEFDRAFCEFKKAVSTCSDNEPARKGLVYGEFAEVCMQASRIDYAVQAYSQGIDVLKYAANHFEQVELLRKNFLRSIARCLVTHPHVFGVRLEAVVVRKYQGAIHSAETEHPSFAVPKLQDALIDVAGMEPLVEARLRTELSVCYRSQKKRENAEHEFELAMACCDASPNGYGSYLKEYAVLLLGSEE